MLEEGEEEEAADCSEVSIHRKAEIPAGVRSVKKSALPKRMKSRSHIVMLGVLFGLFRCRIVCTVLPFPNTSVRKEDLLLLISLNLNERH